MNNFLNLFLNIIRRQLATLFTKLRMLTNPTYWRTIVFARAAAFFKSLLNIKPRDKDDYYPIFGWLVSKRLAYLAVVGVGLASIIYLAKVSNIYFGNESADGVKTYSYMSPFLKLAKGQVRIKGKGGYIAYEGTVDKGYVMGEGTLYDKEECLVYDGNFVQNKYEGMGKLYYKNGSVKYDGQFSGNQFNGEGSLYRSNGSLEYIGAFSAGLKDGEGKLYNTSNEAVFTGRFERDTIAYSDLLAKSTADVTAMYTGSRKIYQGDEIFAVTLDDINAIYDGRADSENLDDSIKVETVYVLEDHIVMGGESLHSMDEIKEAFGELIYEGRSEVEQTEALAIAMDRERSGNLHYNPVNVELELVYDDYFKVSSFEQDKLVYLYAFDKDGIVYTFVCQDKDMPFGFYFLEREEAFEEPADEE